MDFRSAFLAAADGAKLSKSQQAKLESIKSRQVFPRFWAAVENAVVHRYERETGNEVPTDATGAFDWANLIEWLRANLPTIIKVVITIMGFFA